MTEIQKTKVSVSIPRKKLVNFPKNGTCRKIVKLHTNDDLHYFWLFNDFLIHFVHFIL